MTATDRDNETLQREELKYVRQNNNCCQSSNNAAPSEIFRSRRGTNAANSIVHPSIPAHMALVGTYTRILHNVQCVWAVLC